MPWTPIPAGVKTYALVVMGYHAGDLFTHAFVLERTDAFVEMLLHHACTFFLFGIMICVNIMGIGCLITFLHDLSEVPVSLIKMFVNTPYNSLSLVSFFSLLVVWIYTRNYVFVIWTYESWMGCGFTEPELDQFHFIFWFANSMNVILCILHYYWLALFFNMFLMFKKSGVTTDTQSLKSKKEQ